MPSSPCHVEPAPAFPRWSETLRDRRQVVVRPVERQDVQARRAFVEALASSGDRALALARPEPPSQVLLELLDRDGGAGAAFIAVAREDGRDRIVGACRYVPEPGGDACEAAVAVLEDWQAQGLGSALMRHLIDAARARGMRWMHSIDSAENLEMHDLARHLGFHSRALRHDPALLRHALELRPAAAAPA